MKKKIYVVVTTVCLMASALTGCGKKNNSSKLGGNLTLAGSTSMEKLCEGLSESFMEANPEVTVTVEYTGSGAGLESLAASSVDIGNASRKIKTEEKTKV